MIPQAVESNHVSQDEKLSDRPHASPEPDARPGPLISFPTLIHMYLGGYLHLKGHKEEVDNWFCRHPYNGPDSNDSNQDLVGPMGGHHRGV